VFDDSFLHSVAHNGYRVRVTLMLDLWHPDLTKIELTAFEKLVQAARSYMNLNQFFHSLGILEPCSAMKFNL